MTLTVILNTLLIVAVVLYASSFIRAIKTNREAKATFWEAKEAFDRANSTFRKAIAESVRPQIHIVHVIHDNNEGPGMTSKDEPTDIPEKSN